MNNLPCKKPSRPIGEELMVVPEFLKLFKCQSLGLLEVLGFLLVKNFTIGNFYQMVIFTKN
jgi:hypothetical protein